MEGKDYFSAAFGLVSQPVLAVEGGLIKYMNPTACRLFGEARLGCSAAAILPEHILSAQASAFTAGAEIAGESCTVKACVIDGYKVFFVEMPVEEEFGSAAFLAAMRSNLANIKIAADMISESVAPSADSGLQRYFGALTHNYYQLKRLVVNLSALNGINGDTLAFSPSAVDLGGLCGDIVSAVAPFASERGISITCDCPRKITAVADAELTELMILNLLSNSLLHIPSGGRIKITLSDISSYVVLTITDTGTGIPPEELDTVFAKYRRDVSLASMSEGAGLGLSIARGIAERHGGAMMIESPPCSGTIVRVTISKRLPPTGTFKAAEASYSPKGMDEVLTQLSTWLSPEDYRKELQD